MRMNDHMNPGQNEYTITALENDYIISWNDGDIGYRYGVKVGHGGVQPIECLLEKAGFKQSE